jgi:hypothetical protein
MSRLPWPLHELQAGAALPGKSAKGRTCRALRTGTRGQRHAMSRRSLRIPSSLNDPRGLVQSRPLPPQFAHGSADASPAQSGQGDAA